MRYVLKLEAIGDNYSAYLRHFLKSKKVEFGYHELQAFRLGNKRFVPWVARLTGLDAHFGFVREFVRGQKDYSEATSSGSRGIYFYYALKPGLYEINERVTWKRARRYFARVVDDKTLIELSREEVMRCLQNGASG